MKIAIRTAVQRDWIVGAVLVAGLIAVTVTAFKSRDALLARDVQALEKSAAGYQRQLTTGSRFYVGIDRDVAALFAASRHVTATEFRHFVTATGALEDGTGIDAIGYLPRVPVGDIPMFNQVMSRAFPDYRVSGTPSDATAAYPLVYATPPSKRLADLRGTDFGGVPERRIAMAVAARSGKPIATESHIALDDPLQRSVVLVFAPIYDMARPLDGPLARKAAVRGFTFTTFLVDDMIENILGPRGQRDFDLEIYQNSPAADNLIYDGDNHPDTLSPDPRRRLIHQGTLTFGNRLWQLYFYADRDTVSAHATTVFWLVLISGGFAALFLTYLSYRLLAGHRLHRFQRSYSRNFDYFFANHPFAVYSLDARRRFLSVNRAAAEEFGAEAEALIGTSVDRLIVPENVAMARRRFHEALRGNAVTYENTIVNHHGERCEMVVALIPVTIGRRVVSVLGFAQNVTARKRAQAELHESRQMLQLILDTIPQRVLWKDANSVYQGCNRALARSIGLASPEAIAGLTDHDMPWKARADDDIQDDTDIRHDGRPRLDRDVQDTQPDGETRWSRVSKLPLRDTEGDTIGVLVVAEDITERKRLEENLYRMAHYDDLSGLPNRTFFYEQLEQAVRRARRRGGGLGLLYFDIDHFKTINDTYGHDVGDAVIHDFAQRVQSVIRGEDVVARLGGDEFALLVENVGEPEVLATIADKLLAAIRRPFEIPPHRLTVGSSIGWAHYRPEMTVDDFVRAADQAMYRAKQAGRGTVSR